MKYVSLREGKMDWIISEEFKSLRTNIQFCGADKKVIMLTSCTPGEGKSTTSLRLAMSLAELGKRTLLLDTDLRRSVLLGKLSVSGKETLLGLTHFLSGQAELQDVRCATDVPNLHLIAAGPFPPNPAELLSSELFQEAVEAFRKVYDYVIVDTAPLGTVIDAAIVSNACDGAVMVIESGAIDYKFAQDTLEQLQKSGCPVLGVILNKVDAKSMEYGKYGRYGKYSKYGKYSGYGDYSSPSVSGSKNRRPAPQKRTQEKAVPKNTAASKSGSSAGSSASARAQSAARAQSEARAQTAAKSQAAARAQSEARAQGTPKPQSAARQQSDQSTASAAQRSPAQRTERP